MGNFDNSANTGMQIIFKFIEERRKEKNISQLQLSELIGINESTLIRNLKGESAMTLATLLKICGALELRPFLIPAEVDNTEFQRMFFN
ncbi:XRE family transcriptional regulator [Chryseobacterium bernardetii]|uniref:XRE family transcriptional regulator n=1 Tax=Chryseobacterium bernardetii TaxID=1241978 RepID=A0A3G6T737_9FLAO|nr:helix-turn-helix transcriptional regulator [Chryseobacterium bernardetii]AZB23623.1 XRE family transcriptional regulator [Chryseobacterium bernardetii]